MKLRIHRCDHVFTESVEDGFTTLWHVCHTSALKCRGVRRVNFGSMHPAGGCDEGLSDVWHNVKMHLCSHSLVSSIRGLRAATGLIWAHLILEQEIIGQAVLGLEPRLRCLFLKFEPEGSVSTRLGITADTGANVINYQSFMNNVTADAADLNMTSLFEGGLTLEHSDLILFWIQICFLVITSNIFSLRRHWICLRLWRLAIINVFATIWYSPLNSVQLFHLINQDRTIVSRIKDHHTGELRTYF